MRLACEIFGGHDVVRDQLNALPEEYRAWLEGERMPPPKFQRLIALLVEQQGRLVEQMKKAHR